MAELPKSTIHDGWFYSVMIDPHLKGLHRFIAKQIPEGSRHLDACCGTGALAFRLAGQCEEVVGVDLSPKMIRFADTRRKKLGRENVRFSVGDVTSLDGFEDHAFDSATIVMAVHEMPPHIRLPAIKELLRVAKQVMLVDFKSPMPWNPSGILNRLMEILAGLQHFIHFRDFAKKGGFLPLLEDAKANILTERVIDSGNKMFYVVNTSA